MVCTVCKLDIYMWNPECAWEVNFIYTIYIEDNCNLLRSTSNTLMHVRMYLI